MNFLESTATKIDRESLKNWLNENGLGWTVRAVQEKHPVTGEPIDFFATMREDTQQIFQTGFKSYQPINHLDCFEPIAKMSEVGGIALARSFQFRGGRTVAIQCDLGEMHIGNALKNGKPDTVKKRLTFATSHDGTAALNVIVTPIRIICQNTLAAALRGAKVKEHTKISIRHTAGGLYKVEQLAHTYKVLNGIFTATEEIYNGMALAKLTNADARDILNDLFPIGEGKDKSARNETAQNDVIALLRNSDQGQTETGTAWSLYNAITRRNDHFGITHQGEVSSKELARMKSAILGDAADKNQFALDTIVKTMSIGKFANSKPEETIDDILSGLRLDL